MPAPAGSTIPDLGVQGGKDGELRLLNLANLSGSATGQPSPGHTGGEIQLISGPGGEFLTQPAVWVDGSGVAWVEVSTDSGLAGYRLASGTNGMPRLIQAWRDGVGATSPLVANGILYAAGNGRSGLDILSAAHQNPLALALCAALAPDLMRLLVASGDFVTQLVEGDL